MEQKAVTYKTIKGMARDMAMSSGNNDFSYENYNIRITTRGKEDSLVVTNERGTESNIIATRDVLKTVNNVFVGMQPGFYVDEYTEVTGSNIDKYDYTELYKESEDAQHNTIYVPIEKKDYEDAHLVQYDTYSVTAETFESIKLALYIKVSDDYIKLQEDAVFVQGQTYYRKDIVIDPSVTFYKKNEINTITSLVSSTTNNDTTTYTDNGIIKFALNTEYPTDSELVAKSVFKIKESPITYDGEQYTLLNDGEYINENQLITINAESNYGYDTESIKEIVLNGENDNGILGYTVASNVTSENFNDLKSELYTASGSPLVYTKVAIDATYSSLETYYRLNNIEDKKWLDSYKTLYNKITDNNFTFSGFSAIMNDIDYVDSSTLSYIPITTNSNSVTLPTGSFKEGDTYESGSVSEPTDTGDNLKKVVADIPELGFLNSVVFSKNYPVNTTLYINQTTSKIRVPIFKKAETYVDGKTYYDITVEASTGHCDIPIPATNVTSSNVTNYYERIGYLEITFGFDIKTFFGNSLSKKANSITKTTNTITSTTLSATLDYSFYSTSNPNSACFSLNINGNLGNSEYYYSPGGPFFESSVKEKESFAEGEVPDIFIGNTIYRKMSTENNTSLTLSGNDYIECNIDTKLPSGYSFYKNAVGIDSSNFDEKKAELYYLDNNVYISAANTSFVDGRSYYYQLDYKTTINKISGDNPGIYNIYKYEITSSNDYISNTPISDIKTTKDINNVYYTELTLLNATLIYNKLTKTISKKNVDGEYYIYKIKIDNHPIDYIVYSKDELEDISSAKTIYKFTGSEFSEIEGTTMPTMLPSDLSNEKVQLIVGDGTIEKNNGVYKFGDTIVDNTTVVGSTIKSLEKIDYLPIYETNGFTYTLVNSSDKFTEYKNAGYKFYTRSGSSPNYTYTEVTPEEYIADTYYVKLDNTTSVDSLSQVLYENPDYNTVVNHFKFITNNFKSSLDVQSFRLKRSNNNWDNKFVYNFLTQGADFVDYARKLIPMSVLDTYKISDPIVEYNLGSISFRVDIFEPESNYFSFTDEEFNSRLDNLDIIVKDKNDKSFNLVDTLYNFYYGNVVYQTTGVKHDSNSHSFYIKDIRENNLPSELYLEVEKEKDNIGFEDRYIGSETITLQILKGKESYVGKRFVRQIIDFGDHQTISTIEFSFDDLTYKNKFFSILSNDLLVANFGEYHALTIPGRILGSCTIDDYVVLFFHYSSPALNYYKHDITNDIYVLCPPNSIDLTNPDYYELYTRNTRMGFDLAAKNGSLLRDDNNDYINGKNEDYIIKLKYIDARPDNYENEWSEIVTKISNVSTQSSLSTDVTMKKPYYSADILYHGNLGFNANNGIETIGYYESKDVIKVYFTDGKNQPRMIDIMTPLSQRNGTHKRWDAKSFDFIQEINGKEEYDIVKQFGGGAFPAGTVQYYFTYTNLGGCETNPFICSPIYYTSQSDTGNSPLKITDNTFKIKLTNLSTRFDYVNIYSVVRTTKDMQTLCKRVINISLNGKTEIEFTDNNLLGEIVDSSYLLMLQGTPISALTMAEKDNTLFLGNINKLQKALTIEDKEKLKNCFEVKDGLREYQNYNPNEDNWYENKVKDKIKLDYYGNEVKDANGDNIIDSKISLEGNSSDIKTFMYNEYYRLGIQLQDKFGKWSDPIFIEDRKCGETINTKLTEKEDKEDKHIYVDNIITKIPYFYLLIKDKDELKNIISDYGYIRIRPVIVYPNISSRNVLCQGLLNPTMFNYSDRSMNAPFNFASYFFRPMPPAISNNKDESGNNLHNVDITIPKVCGYPIEYRHGYPISGYHDAIEEGLAESENTDDINDNTVKALVDNYLSKQDVSTVKLTSGTPGWWIGGRNYLREGIVEIRTDHKIHLKGKVYSVSIKNNKGKLNFENTIDTVVDFDEFPTGCSSDSFKDFATRVLGAAVYSGQGVLVDQSKNAIGFTSHIHYHKNVLLNFAIFFLAANPATATLLIADMMATGGQIIKKEGDVDCGLGDNCLIFNEGGVSYEVPYPCSIKFLPKSDIKQVKHRGLKRRQYFCDIVVTHTGNSEIKLLSKSGSDGYIDDPGTSTESNAANKKAYFAANDGEIQCANGNKNYNLFKNNLVDILNKTYNSSEINPASRQQSLFYIDESICTLNSPEIEYDPTVQKIDLSTYKLNIIGAANITGYAQNIRIDAETPPATAGTTVCEGFKHDNIEVQNFNKEAYRYMLSGGYWYDNVFYEGDDENPERKYDSADLISDQYCWWVYPFNRQILNNSKEGANGKLRTKQWYNYHYSAFNDYFKTSSIDYELKDAQQLYGDFQSITFDTDWTTRKCLYFGSVDTAYTNPVPLCGLLGGSNEPDENAYEQSLAISPHTTFKDKDSYSAANYADIVPLAFRSTNHFLLSLKGYNGNNRVLPEYYTNTNLLETEGDEQVGIETKEYYKILTCDNVDLSSREYFIKEINYSGKEIIVYKFGENGTNLVIGSLKIGGYIPKYLNLTINDSDYNPSEIIKRITYKTLSDKFTYEKKYIQTPITANNTRMELLDDNYIGIKKYTTDLDKFINNKQVNGCERPYIQYNNENAGIYKYGHVYIAQLERGVKSADEVFSGTEESVLLQNTWIPAGVAINIDDAIGGKEIQYTEGDTFYQRYDCLKTYGYNEASVNQVIESLSTMIQTRINLDGIYSLRGNIDNLGTNETNTNLLNTAYSQSDNYFTYSITDPYISQITEYSNMFTWTLTKQAMSRNDNWLAVNLIAYYNATGSFGKITRIINYRNNLFCFQDNAISQIAYNERVALTPSDGVPIEIGNSGKVQGLNYISSNVGCQNRWSVCPSKGYLYWVDDRRAEIYRFGEGLEPFSTANGFSDWVKANTYGEDWKPILSTNVPITTYYDNNNDDIYFVTEKDCLAYNEKINAFESFFSYEDSFILNSAGNTIVIKEQDALVKDMLDYTDLYNDNDTSWWSNGIRGDGLSSIELMHEGEYNKFFGDYKPYYLRFKVYPTDLQRDKIYTNLEFNLDAFDEKDIYMPDDTFTRVRVWNEYQWGEMNFDNIYGTTSYKKRFRTWYLQLPRASYYPTGLYENYDYLYQRQLEWNYITSDVLADKTLAYYSYWNENSNCVNDRIRNPWVWLELYKNPKASLNFEQYILDKQKEDSEVKNCTQAYYNEHKFDLFEVVSGKFVRQEESSYYDENKKYYNCIDNYLEKRDYLYYKVYVQVSKDDHDKYDILYSSTAEDAQPYTGDRTNPSLILYRLDYRNCANILTFDTEKVYYKLNISNNRMEIHDIILKYFEA